MALIHGCQILIDLRLQLPPGGLIQSIGLAEVFGDPPDVISLPKCEVHDPKKLNVFWVLTFLWRW